MASKLVRIERQAAELNEIAARRVSGAHEPVENP
jgi:hypothetical protein